MSKVSLEVLENNVDKVEKTEAELTKATEVLTDNRRKVWRLLGNKPMESMKVGGLTFSKPVVAIGVVCAAGFVTSSLMPMMLAIALTSLAGVAGFCWLRGMFRS